MAFTDLDGKLNDSEQVLLQKISQRLGQFFTANDSEQVLLGKILDALNLSSTSVLTTARTYYVATTGSDSNTGLDATVPFRTIQKAIDTAQALSILANVNVTIQLADGTYTVTSAITCRQFGGWGQVIIQGNAANKAAVVVSTATAGISLFSFIGTGGSRWVLQHLTLSGLSSNIGVLVDSHARLSIGNLGWSSAFSAGVSAALNSSVQFIGTAYTIAGAMSQFILCQRNAFVLGTTTGTWTISGTPAIAAFVTCIDQGNVRISSANVTFSGSATGARYSAAMNSIIQTNGGGANFFPGDSAGSVATGGVYS